MGKRNEGIHGEWVEKRMWNEEKKAKARRQASTDWQKKILYRMKMKEEKKYFQENENTKNIYGEI